jgi:hypothetical protein
MGMKGLGWVYGGIGDRGPPDRQQGDPMKPLNQKHYGVVSIDDRKALSGLEFVTGFVDGSLPLNTMARTLGYDIV